MIDDKTIADAFAQCAIKRKQLVDSDVFYFAEAHRILEKFENINVSDEVLQDIISMDYEDFKRSSDTLIHEIKETIFDFVAHCDINASDKRLRNRYEDNRTIANCQIRQHIWVKHLLKYKRKDTQINESILNMLDYVHDPVHYYPIISERHKKLIIQKLCDKNYNKVTFADDLNNVLRTFENPSRIEENKTYFAMRALYDIQDEWSDGGESDDEGGSVWLWQGDKDTLKLDRLCTGSMVHPHLKDFEQFTRYEDMRDAYQQARGNADVSIPDAFWKFISKVKVGDIVVVYSNSRYYNKNTHLMHGWGRFTSDIIYNKEDENPLQRTVEWMESCDQPVRDTKTNNALFFHGTTPIQAETIKQLLNIDDEESKQAPMIDNKILNLLLQKKQIILQGAPGTGKTYSTASLAIALCNNVDTSTMSREEVMKQYKELQQKGRIGFTTFHQSMDYEEFVEGIKPVKEEDGTISYDVKDGLFKRICQKASHIESSAVVTTTNTTPTIWKVSLQGTGNNPIRTDCMTHGRIRLGWDEYGPEITDETQYTNGGKIVLDAFINKMQVGDYVLSCFSARTIDAIGIVTGDYEWLEGETGYRRSRKVEWIVKGISEDIVELNNGHPMTLSSVYRLNNITNEKLKFLLDKYQTGPSVKKSVQETKPYLLIIDEINRGNISKILGELITLLEADKRLGKVNEVTVTLPYSESDFGVPDNLYIIGTMNTADRSVGYIDYAIRRRFAFVTLKADSEIIARYYSDNGLKAIALGAFNKIHQLMQEKISSDFEVDDLMIGHSYFLAKNKAELLNKLEFEVFPLLQEYIHDGLLNVRKDDQELNEIFDIINQA